MARRLKKYLKLNVFSIHIGVAQYYLEYIAKEQEGFRQVLKTYFLNGQYKNPRILDICCGVANEEPLLIEHFGENIELVGIDNDKSLGELLKELGRKSVRFGDIRELEDLVNDKKFDDIGLKDGITILERREYDKDARDLYSCEKYVLGSNKLPWDSQHDWSSPPPGYVEVTHPQTNDLVIYFNEGRPNHLGRFTDNNSVKSKWGRGHIFQHPLDAVPSFYGNEVRFFRQSE